MEQDQQDIVTFIIDQFINRAEGDYKSAVEVASTSNLVETISSHDLKAFMDARHRKMIAGNLKRKRDAGATDTQIAEEFLSDQTKRLIHMAMSDAPVPADEASRNRVAAMLMNDLFSVLNTSR